MRHQTLKTYAKDKFLEYYGKPLGFKTLLVEPKSDSRLAELLQVHFLLKGDQCKSDEFARYTG